MKVLHVYRTYFPETQGGLEETIRQICATTAPHGVESRVLTLTGERRPSVLQRPEAEVHRMPKHLEVASCGFGLTSFGPFRELARWADVVHYHFPWPFADLLHLAGGGDRPSVVTYHSDTLRQKVLKHVYAPLMHRFLSRVDRIVATSPHYAETSPVLRRYRDKVSVIPFGLDEATYPRPTPEDLAAAEAEYGRDFFFFIGVLRYYKGLHILLDALAEAPATLRVLIAGRGPLEAELQAQAQRLGLGDRVRFIGRIDDQTKTALMTLSRGTVFPSHLRTEAFGITLLESAMLGRPMISCAIGTGTDYINRAGETGLVIPPADPKALREALERLHRDPAEAAEMGRAARAWFETGFTGARMGGLYAGLYADLLGRAAPVRAAD